MANRSSYIWTPPVGAQINRAHPLANGLLSCWLFNENGGGVVNDCASVNSGIFTVAPIWSASGHGPSLKFDGSTTYVTTLSSPLNPSTQPFTASCWFYVSALPGAGSSYSLISQLDGTGTGQPWLYIDTSLQSNKVSSFLGGSATAGATPVTGMWNHCAVTSSPGTPGTVKVYQNGVLTATNAGIIAQSSTGTIRFGANKTPANFLSGQLNDVRVYKRVLTYQEIKEMYANPWGIFLAPKRRMIGSAATPVTIVGTGGSIAEFAIAEAPIAGSPTTPIVFNNSLTETVTESDNYTILATGIPTLIENNTETDSYLSSTTNIAVFTESDSVSDSLTIAAIDSNVVIETVAANDNYVSTLIPLGGGSAPQTGSGSDSWSRYLLWLDRKKRKQFKRRAEYVKIPVKEAAEIARIAAKEVLKQEIELKTPYYSTINQNEQLARHTAQIAINQIYEAVWETKVREAVRKQREDEEEEFFMLML